MTKSLKPKIEVTTYHMSLHMGAVLGPVNRWKKLVVGDKVAWEGEVSDNQIVTVNKTSLFGGVKKEGGVQGDIHFLNGGPTQELSTTLAGKLGRTFANSPGFRGFTSFFFTELASAGHGGFYWTANSPQMPNIKVTLEDIPDDWYPGRAGIAQIDEEEGAVLSEVPRGEYSLQSQPNIIQNRIYDFEGRKYYTITLGTGPSSEDEIHEYTMLDNSLVVSRILNWSPTVTSTLFTTNYDQFNGDVAIVHVNSGAQVAINPQTGALLSPTPFPNGGHVLDHFHVDGVLHLLMHNTGGSQVRVVKYAAGVFTELAGAGPPAIPGATNFKFLGSQNLSGETRVYWHRLTGDIFEATVTAGGGVTTRTIWASHATGNPAYYDPSDGGMLIKNGTTLTKYNFFDETFTQIWQNVGDVGILSGIGQISNSNIDSRIIFGRFDGAFQWFDLITGQLLDTLTHTLLSIVGLRFVQDDIGGAMWYDSNGTPAWRFQGDPLPPLVDCFDANPAHIVYDVLTDTEHGLGVPVAKIDDAAFRAAANTLFSERLGLAILWSQQLTGEEFTDEILAHIEGVVYFDPHTGLIVLKLIRDDYDPASLRTITVDNAELTSFRRKSLGETVNQVTVTYTNGDNEEEATVTLQDLGNIAQQGEIVSDSVTYAGVRTARLAMQLARRDLRVASYPVATAEVLLDHSFWDIVPGDPVKLTWVFPNGDTITDMVMRVGEVTKGHKGRDEISVKLSEDIFALAVADFATPPNTMDQDTREDPRDLDYVNIFTLPYYWAVNLIDAGALAASEEPEAFAGIVAAQGGSDTAAYDVLGEETDALGNLSFASFGSNTIVARSVLAVVLAQEAQTVLADFPNPTQGPLPVVGSFILIGDGPEADSEIAIVSAVNPGVDYTLKRGMLDTVPKAWPAGTPLWVIDAGGDIVDNQAYAAPDTVSYKLLSITSIDTLDEASATLRMANLSERPYRPLRPAAIDIEGVAFGSADANGLTEIDVTWANRNRLTEDFQVLFWDDADVTVETGQTTTIQALDVAKVLINEATGLAGTSHAFPVSSFTGAEEGFIRVIAERDGYASFQGHDIHVSLTASFVLLSGDQQTAGDFLLLSGDQQTGTDKLKQS